MILSFGRLAGELNRLVLFVALQIYGQWVRPQELGLVSLAINRDRGGNELMNGYSNTDMDLCCFLAKDAPMRPASELVQVLGSLIEQGPFLHFRSCIAAASLI